MDQLTQLFIEAGTLMLTGMLFVFSFLGLLVIFINTVLAKLAISYPDPIIQSKPQRRTNTVKNAADEGVAPSIVAAISSAVSQYRKQHKK